MRSQFTKFKDLFKYEITFDSSKTQLDCGHEIIKRIYDFGDGSSISTTDLKVNHIYSKMGKFIINLTIETDCPQTSTITGILNVGIKDLIILKRIFSPIIVKLMAKIPHPGSVDKKVSIIIPAFNESHTIVRTINNIKRLKIPKLEIIVIDDGSSDGTPELALEQRVSVTRHQKNLGYGPTVNTGFKQVSGDIIVIFDADLTAEYNTIPRLIKPIIDDSADIVIGSSSTSYKTLHSLFMNMIYHRLFDTESHLIAIRYNEKIKNLNIGRDFNYILLKKSFPEYRITEVPMLILKKS